jgi:hypothetical protein
VHASNNLCIYRIFHDGFGLQGFPHNYILVIGGIFSTICPVAYANMIVSERTQYRRNVAVVMGGFVPYAFALYVMAYLGRASLWKQITSTFTIGGLIFGVFWLLIG